MSDNNSDNWSNLLNDFGIDEPAASTPEAALTAVTPEKVTPSVGEAIAEPPAVSDVPVNPKERKSIFSRFPKINLFGSPPKESLDAIAGGGKAASLGGKSFTGNTIEKVQGVTFREHKEDSAGSSRKKERQDEDALPAIVSQLDAFAAGENPLAETAGSRRNRRQPVSIFEEPVPRAEDYEAAQKFFGEPTGQRRNRTDFEETKEESGEAGRRPPNRNAKAFEEESFDDRPVRERGGRKPPVIDDVTIDEEWQEVDDVRDVAERPRRGRTSQNRERSSNAAPHNTAASNVVARGAAPKRYGNAVRHDIDDAPSFAANDSLRDRDSSSREHGTREYAARERTSREYAAREREPVVREREEYSAGEGKPQTDQRQRGGRGRKFEESRRDYPQPVQREYEPQYEPDTADAAEQTQLHRNIPGWEDAVGDIVAGNIARHRNNPPQSYRGKR